MRCSYCGSHLHPTDYCPNTASGQGNRNVLRCSYCGSKKHNADACEKKWPGPDPIKILD